MPEPRGAANAHGHDPPTGVPWLVVIGASSDGYPTLLDLMNRLPASLDAAVLVVLHRPADRQSQLPSILRRHCHMPVVVPEQGERLVSGRCYVADADHHLSIGPHGVIDLRPDHAYRNRTVDLLFATAAKHAGARVVGVVLPGYLQDGAAGLAAIAQTGGAALIIDSVWTARDGMPKAAHIAVPRAILGESADHLARLIVEAVQAPSSPSPI